VTGRSERPSDVAEVETIQVGLTLRQAQGENSFFILMLSLSKHEGCVIASERISL
jgi:hypothetical protein